METVIIVEQGRINWKGEYLPITYAPVDTQKTAAYVLNQALKEYKGQPGTKVKKLDKGLYEIRIKCSFAEDEVYFLRIKELTLVDMKFAKEQMGHITNRKKDELVNITFDME